MGIRKAGKWVVIELSIPRSPRFNYLYKEFPIITKTEKDAGILEKLFISIRDKTEKYMDVHIMDNDSVFFMAYDGEKGMFET